MPSLVILVSVVLVFVMRAHTHSQRITDAAKRFTPAAVVGVSKAGFHYPSLRPELTGRVDSPSTRLVETGRPSTRPVLTGNGNRSPVNSGRQVG